jgi:drug/metabolite transporter (DMT)-like permease
MAATTLTTTTNVGTSASAQRLGLIGLAGVALGSSVVMTRMGVSEIPPLSLVTLRLALATLAFAVLLLGLRRRLPRQPRQWLDIAVVGVANSGIPLLFFTIAVQFISSSVLTLFITLSPLLTGVMAHAWLAHEKLSPTKLGGLLVALAGVVVLISTGTTGLAAGAAGLDLRGPLLALAGVVVGSAGAVYTRLRLRQVDVLVVTAGQMLAGLLFVLPFALALSSLSLAAVGARGWTAVAYSGLVGSFTGFLLLFYLIKRFGATIASLATYLMPVVAASLGAVILGEVITLPLVAAAGLILAGVVVVNRSA